MNRILLSLLVVCLNIGLAQSQNFSGQYISEWQWGMNGKTNMVNQLRLEMNVALPGEGNSLNAATLHVAKTSDSVIDDWQVYSNIDADNMFAAIAVLGYMHEWKHGKLFLGVRNVNEDFFTSSITSLFTNSSGGIFPTIAASYPIANYPLSGLTVYFDLTRGDFTFRNSLYNGRGYNGWTSGDNPLIVRPGRDGLFNISQLEYSHGGTQLFAGAALHTRQFPVDDEGEMLPESSCLSKASCAWWIYGEQALWTEADRSVACIAQYSENTRSDNSCRRFAEVGCAYSDSRDECALSFQYAQFRQGGERSLELTWKRQIGKAALQPSFQYVANANGNFTVLSARLYYSF